jgi:hypothetical protein
VNGSSQVFIDAANLRGIEKRNNRGAIWVTMTEPLAVGDRVGGQLLECPSTSHELAQALNMPESIVLEALDEMRQQRLVQFAGGEWSLTGVQPKKETEPSVTSFEGL